MEWGDKENRIAVIALHKVGTPVIVLSVRVNIDGLIDFGQKWNLEYNIKSGKNRNPHNEFFMAPDSFMGKQISEPKFSIARENDDMSQDIMEIQFKPIRVKANANEESPSDSFGIQKAQEDFTTKDDTISFTSKLDEPYGLYEKEPYGIYEKPYTVKEDRRINDFSYHVYKQSLKVFDEMKKKVNPAYKDKVDYLAKNYDTIFRAFINETLHQKVKTRLGSQKVVLNIIDTSNRLLKRLVNYFIGDMTKEGALRNNMAAANVFQKEVDRECELELKHACTKFGICRTSTGFSDFLIDLLTVIIQSDDRKIKQASDALTEVLKNTDFGKVMDSKTKRNFKRIIELIETYDTIMIKAVFMIAKNVLALRNWPINVMVKGSHHINNTVAFLEFIEEVDKQLPSNDENKLEWHDIHTSLTDWSNGTREDILEIMQGLVTFLKKKGIDALDDRAARNVRDKFKIIFS